MTTAFYLIDLEPEDERKVLRVLLNADARAMPKDPDRFWTAWAIAEDLIDYDPERHVIRGLTKAGRAFINWLRT